MRQASQRMCAAVFEALSCALNRMEALGHLDRYAQTSDFSAKLREN